MSESEMNGLFKKAIPYLTVSNMDASIKFYSEKLGFKVHGVYGTMHASISLGENSECNFYLRQVTEEEAEKFKNSARSHTMIMVDPKGDKKTAVDEVAASVVSKGVKLSEECEDKWWGYRQFSVRDPDGESK
jgi:uncharacterized glyoxalase superfamily protein PhnB